MTPTGCKPPSKVALKKQVNRWSKSSKHAKAAFPRDVSVKPTRSPVRLTAPAEFSGASSPAAWFEAF